MNIKNILLFIGGMAVGAAAGVFGSKKYYQKRYEEDRAALEEYYRRTDEYARVDHEDEEDNEVNPTEVESRPGGRMDAEERASMKQHLNRKSEEFVDYAGAYKGNKPKKPAGQCQNCSKWDNTGYCTLDEEKMGPEDGCSRFEAYEEVNLDEEAFDDHEKNKNRNPKIISAEAYGGLPAHIEKKVLYLYAFDEIVVDEDNEDEPIDEPERLIGDALTKYNFIDNDESIIFVMNYSIDTCFEVQKIRAAWTDSH